MAYVQNLWLFFLLLAGIVIVPGMDMMFVLANALAGGRLAGLVATFGMMAGGACHILFATSATAGLSRWMPAIAAPMLAIGSAYMMWIGLSLARSAIVVDSVNGIGRRPPRAVFAQAVATCLLNPKAWLFTLAVVPQFLKPGFGPLLPQALVMGTMTVSMQLLVYGGVALAAARGRDAIVANPTLTIWVGRSAGALLIAVALYTLTRSWAEI